jgi:hypothetical protein
MFFRYVLYSSISENHQISFELLAPDYLSSTKKNFGFFPDTYVEGGTMFKRNGTYYVM